MCEYFGKLCVCLQSATERRTRCREPTWCSRAALSLSSSFRVFFVCYVLPLTPPSSSSGHITKSVGACLCCSLTDLINRSGKGPITARSNTHTHTHLHAGTILCAAWCANCKRMFSAQAECGAFCKQLWWEERCCFFQLQKLYKYICVDDIAHEISENRKYCELSRARFSQNAARKYP